jgi:FlaA1/EpsC-like NDP-sugar epimerase
MLSFLVALPSRAKAVVLLTADAVLIPLALWGAYALRLGEAYAAWQQVMGLSAVLVLLSLPVFMWQGLYRTVTRHIKDHGLWLLVNAALWSGAVLGVVTLVQPDGLFLPRSVFAIYGMLLFTLLAASRATAASLLGGNVRRKGEPVAIYGAGESGRQLAATLRLGLDYMPVVFLERDPALKGRSVDTLSVLDPYRDDLANVLANMGVREILLAIPGLQRTQRRSILDRLEKLMFRVRTVPSMEDILSGKARLDQLEEVSIDDLLGRDAVPALPGLLGSCIGARCVLVTGAGGSIGSELCRQVLQQGAKRLVLLEHSEVALYQIEMELRQMIDRAGLPTQVVAVLGSVQDEALVHRVFATQGVQTVYHAAAYKHVPMVEANPFQGLRNNVNGTWVVANLARKFEVCHFVLISTDKAVRPTNVMGASKRLAELVVQAYAAMGSKTVFSMVRFGNVLGSSGSVVPLFRKQIAEGGPVTVTHAEVTRYFMTIPEAVQLVIQAGAMATGGEVFVLDMGEPVRITDLAAKMIHLSGHRVKSATEPNGNIEIKVTGLRPGEKLYEELLIGDAVGGTAHPRIMRAEEKHHPMDELRTALDALSVAAAANDVGAMRELLVQWVSGYKPDTQDGGVVATTPPSVGNKAFKQGASGVQTPQLVCPSVQ